MNMTLEDTVSPGEPSEVDATSAASLRSEMVEVAAELDGASATTVLDWAVGRFGDGLVLASSFQDCVLVDLATRAAPSIRVIFLDTGFHFPETLAYLRRVEQRYDLNLDVRRPEVALDVVPCGAAGCCQLRKVGPLNAALEGASAWVTGVKRVDTPERADAPVVAFDDARGLVKVNPIVAWSEDDVERYVNEHELMRHPLSFVGYASIGCAPTTRPVADGEELRAGRWPGSDKTECGLHL